MNKIDKNFSLEDLERRVRKISTKITLEWCFKFSKFLFNSSLENNEMKGVFWFNYKNNYGGTKKYCVCAWHINYLVYYAILFSNDERRCKNKVLRNIDFYYMLNRCSSLIDDELPKITEREEEKLKFLEGFGEDQFKYQLNFNHFNDLNRLIYIFCKSEYDKTISNSLEEIVKNKFNCNVYSYLKHMSYILGSYAQNENYSKFHTLIPEHFVQINGIEYAIVEKIIRYYSITYLKIRESNLKQLALYSKPFVINKNDEVLCANIYNLYFVFGDCLYWLIRDEYKKISTDFISKFGKMFEKYFFDLFIQNGLGLYIKKILEDGEHEMPDYEFNYKDYKIIFECKSHIPLIDSIQQIPEIDSINKNLKHIEKAHNQINSYISKNKIKGNIFKIIVEYSHDYDCGLLRNNYKNSDEYLIIVNIVQIEAICLLYSKDVTKFEMFLKKLFNIEYFKSKYFDINNLFFDLEIDVNNYYCDQNRNYIINLVTELEKCN